MPSLERRGRPKCVRSGGTVPRLILMPDAIGPDGEPRAALLMPGFRLPVLYRSVSAAMAAMEVRA